VVKTSAKPPAAADDGHDPIALAEALGVTTEPDHLARQLEAEDVGRRAGRRRVAALALEDVGAVDAGRADANQHLRRAGLRIGMVGDDDLTVAGGCGAHRAGSVCLCDG